MNPRTLNQLRGNISEAHITQVEVEQSLQTVNHRQQLGHSQSPRLALTQVQARQQGEPGPGEELQGGDRGWQEGEELD